MNDAATSSSRPAQAEAAPEATDAARMSFGDHLDELRRCLILAVIGTALATVVTFMFGQAILGFLFRPLLEVQFANGLDPNLQALSPTAAFTAYLKISFLSGLILAMPWILYQIWKFVAVGLYPRERRFAKLLLAPSIALFLLGVVFLYYLVLPMVLQFFVSFNRQFDMPDVAPSGLRKLLLPDVAGDAPTVTGSTNTADLPSIPTSPDDASGGFWLDTTTNRLMLQTPTGVWSTPCQPGVFGSPVRSQFAIDYYISFVLLLALAFGIAFETPVVVFFLAWTGLVSTDRMKRGRRYVLLTTVMLAAILTPPDVISQLMLAIPMYLLFEIGLIAGKWVEKPIVD